MGFIGYFMSENTCFYRGIFCGAALMLTALGAINYVGDRPPRQPPVRQISNQSIERIVPQELMLKPGMEIEPSRGIVYH